MTRKSSGVLLYRENSGQLEVLLVHPGGPFWVKKDEGAWSIPKGEFDDEEDPLHAARREFAEETGATAPAQGIPLVPLRQAGGKLVYAFAMKGDFDSNSLKSNTFSMEWPPKSGKQQSFPEIDRAAWFPLDIALRKILKGQASFLTDLKTRLVNARTNDE